MTLEILLHHEPAERVADHHGRAGQLPNVNVDVIHEISETRPPERVGSVAVAVASQTHGVCGEAVSGEVVEKMHVPAPGAVKTC